VTLTEPKPSYNEAAPHGFRLYLRDEAMTQRSVATGMIFFTFALTAVLFTVSGCSWSANKETATRALKTFRAHMAAEEFHEIYVAGDEELRQQVTEAQLTRVLQMVRNKLGAPLDQSESGLQQGWFTGQGTRLTITYSTRFAKGNGTETFVWHVVGTEARLVGYHVNSDKFFEPDQHAAS